MIKINNETGRNNAKKKCKTGIDNSARNQKIRAKF